MREENVLFFSYLRVLVLESWSAAHQSDLCIRGLTFKLGGAELSPEPEITLDRSQRCIKYWTVVQQVSSTLAVNVCERWHLRWCEFKRSFKPGYMLFLNACMKRYSTKVFFYFLLARSTRSLQRQQSICSFGWPSSSRRRSQWLLFKLPLYSWLALHYQSEQQTMWCI